MDTRSVPSVDVPLQQPHASWMPMVVIAATQIMLVFNVSSLQVSIEAIATSFNAPATIVGTAIVTYALVVAGFIMVGGRIAQRFGARRVFRATVLGFGAGMLLVAASPGPVLMMIAQVIAGASAAVLVPTLVVLIAENYSGRQQERALGLLGGAVAAGIVLTFLIAGFLATSLHWRATFALLVLVAVAIYRLSARLATVEKEAGIDIDRTGAALVAAGILLISIGSNNLASWGTLLARSEAPFSVLDMSPAPIMILCGLFLLQAFLSWSRRLERAGGVPLLSFAVLDTTKERAALFTLFVISAIASAITFLIPLYIQVVQGRSSLDTAAAIIPFALASLVAALLVVRLYDFASPSRIARYGFLVVAAGVALLGIVIRNDWSDAMVVASMVMLGLGEGALMTLLFNVLVTASPKELAGDVGSLRGAANNLATAVGTAVASALVVSILASAVHRDLAHNPAIPDELRTQVDLDNVSFISNDQLRQRLRSTTATAEQVDEAVRLNTDARLVSLKVTFFTLAGLALLAFFPAGALPGYTSRDAGHGA